MEEDVAAQRDDREETGSGAPDWDEAVEPAPSAREEVGRMAGEVHATVAEQIEGAGEVEARVEAGRARARAAGAESGQRLERAAVAAPTGLASVTREARPVAGEVRESADDVVRATRQRIAATEEVLMVPEYRGISFGDGFRFGCGFTIAGCLFWLMLSILLAMIPLLLSAVNVIGLPGR